MEHFRAFQTFLHFDGTKEEILDVSLTFSKLGQLIDGAGGGDRGEGSPHAAYGHQGSKRNNDPTFGPTNKM